MRACSAKCSAVACRWVQVVSSPKGGSKYYHWVYCSSTSSIPFGCLSSFILRDYFHIGYYLPLLFNIIPGVPHTTPLSSLSYHHYDTRHILLIYHHLPGHIIHYIHILLIIMAHVRGRYNAWSSYCHTHTYRAHHHQPSSSWSHTWHHSHIGIVSRLIIIYRSP